MSRQSRQRDYIRYLKCCTSSPSREYVNVCYHYWKSHILPYRSIDIKMSVNANRVETVNSFSKVMLSSKCLHLILKVQYR